jgi:hypothetical protein
MKRKIPEIGSLYQLIKIPVIKNVKGRIRIFPPE